MEAFAQRIADGFLYGDFQYAIDPRSDDFMRRGVFSCYSLDPDSRFQSDWWRHYSRMFAAR